MIDIHTHILPMVDDGARNVDEALEMMMMAYNDGTDAIILTPHHDYSFGFSNPYEEVKHLYEDIKRIARSEHIPVDLYLGTEYLYSSKNEFIKHHEEMTTMNNTRYILVEFYFDVEEEIILEAIDVIKSYQLIPIIAHPERYGCVQNDLDVAKAIVRKGAYLQMNKGSVLNRHGPNAKNIAKEMLAHHLIHFVGSDSHRVNHRTPYMYDAYCYVKERYGSRYADEIFENNASKILGINVMRKRGTR